MCSIGEHLRIKHNISTVTQYRWEHCVQHVHKPSIDTSKQTERQIEYYIEIENVSQIFTLPLTFFPLVKTNPFLFTN